MLLTTKRWKTHFRTCILMKMKVELLLLVSESETEVESGLVLLAELRVDLSLTCITFAFEQWSVIT